MKPTPWRRRATLDSSSSRPAFTLVELLTVVFIIALLIGILVPSLSAARTVAKKTVTAKTIQSVSDAMEMFRNDNGSEFALTNGYPPSFAHPPIPGVDFKPEEGDFPFLANKPVAYGAHWLPAMLMGVDQQGYIKRSSVPEAAKKTPETWYTTRPVPSGPEQLLSRNPLYLNPSSTPTLQTKNLPGRKSDETAFFARWGTPETNPEPWRLLTIVDGFDYPILYYAAYKHGRPTNLVEDKRKPDNNYEGSGPQDVGPPFFFHQDNEGFTGIDEDGNPDNGVTKPGWDFNGAHSIACSGAGLSATQIISGEGGAFTFARNILDRAIYRDLKTKYDESGASAVDAKTPLRPANADKYLLISPGPDGRYGTKDDVSNMPAFFE